MSKLLSNAAPERSHHRGSIDPLKLSPPLGATLVFLGLHRTMPMMHGSQGCSAFAKTLSTRHFREPIPLQTTAVTEITATLGAGPLLHEGLATIASKNSPDLIGVMTTGLTEVNGEDFHGELRQYRDTCMPGGPVVIGVNTPDFTGGLTTGWSAALTALMEQVPLDDPDMTRHDEVAVLVGPGLTAGDVEDLAETIRSFGLEPTMIPDLSNSLDGHLAEGWTPLTTGGTTVAQLRALIDVPHILAIGPSTYEAATVLAQRTGADVAEVEQATGLAAADALVAALMRLSPATVPARLQRWRRRLCDALLDAHFVLAGVKVVVAAEPETLLAVTGLLSDVGAEIVCAVSPSDSVVLAQVPCAQVVIGDLADLEDGSAEAELVIGSSHVRPIAHRLGAAFAPVGFPLYDRLGAQLQRTTGYEGSVALLNEFGNAVLDDHATPVLHA